VSGLRRLALVLSAVLGSLAVLAVASAGAVRTQPQPQLAEVVVTLPQAPLAEAVLENRTLARAATTKHRLNFRAPAAVSYLRMLATAQRALQARITQAIPSASVHWSYGVVLNGLAVVVPRDQLGRLSRVPGAKVWPSVTYHALLNKTPQLIGAPTLWGPTLSTAGQGVKIGIIDDGVDQTHLFFDPTGFTYPAGYPKGNTSFTTPKVIVAKAFAPASTSWKYASTPFDPENSDHATHVAGIAAGDHDTLATGSGGGRVRVSGIAPEAYLGNYKVLTVPTEQFGLDGNSPEIAKGIEEAVKDGMDVINLSLGEPEIEPSRDIVVAAIDNAADAGVVPVVAAGNEFDEAGKGSVGSPGTAPKAITAAASTKGESGPADVIAGFSSSGPTPISLQMKPDVTAPGVDVVSSVPHNQWEAISGTSMASPHVAGSAALLAERHPGWTVAQIKSALESTGDPVHASAGTTGELSVLREGGGRIDLPRADNPLLFTDPTGVSFGLVLPGTTTARQLALSDAGGGAAPWTVTIDPQGAPKGATLAPSAPTAVVGTTVGVTLSVTADAAEGDAVGFVVLTRGTDVRRVPYWAHVEIPRLAGDKHATIARPGTYGGNTAGKQSRVSSYRYPEGSLSGTGTAELTGPEQVFRVKLAKPVANLGAAVITRARGVDVSPRLVVAGDENRLTGFTALPVNDNPYQAFGRDEPVVGAIAPAAGSYDIVFDTPSGGKPGKFTFRVWWNDTTPPTARLVSPTVAVRGRVRVVVSDRGSGVDPRSLTATIDGRSHKVVVSGGVARIDTLAVARGKHRLALTVSDYQEAKNMENVGPILPNTRRYTATFTIR
jgi:subtilisin family serine protease